MRLYSVVLILSMLHLPSADTQEDYWPVHTACNSGKSQVTYRSFGQSIDELYLSVELFINGVNSTRHDEPICLPNFPRFTFCGKRRGEMVTIQVTLPELKLPLKGRYNFKVRGINQNGFQISCVNATAIFFTSI